MSKTSQMSFALGKKNYMMLLIGLVIVILGYALMSGGGSADPNEFNPDLFSARRITLAPFVVLFGYAFIGYAIMLKPTNNEPAAPAAPAKK